MNTRISVLIVEKSQTFSMYLSLLLQRMGFKSLTVGDSATAKIILSRGITDVLIIGDQDGPEPAHVIAKKLAGPATEGSIPVVVISKYDDPGRRKACYDAGCHAYLLKPVQPKLLQDALSARIIPASERRQNLRSKVELTAEVSMDSQPPQPLRVVSLSRGGALLASSQAVPVDTRFTLVLPLDAARIFLAGQVIYTLANGAGPGWAFGVLFRQVSQENGDLIDQYLNQILQQGSLVTDAPGREAGEESFAPAAPGNPAESLLAPEKI